MGISGPLECARLANQIQGFRIPEKLEKKNRELLLPTEKNSHTTLFWQRKKGDEGHGKMYAKMKKLKPVDVFIMSMQSDHSKRVD